MTTTLAESGLGSGHFRRLNLLLYGPFGTWKTVNAHGLPRTRTLDFDDGMLSVEWAIRAGKLQRPGWTPDMSLDDKLKDIVYRTLLPEEYDKSDEMFDLAMDQVDWWLEDEDVKPEEWVQFCQEKNNGIVYPQFWDTLIIDSGTSLTQAALIKAVRENSRLGLSKTWEKHKARGLTPVMVQDRGALNILFQKFLTVCRGLGKNLVLICHEYSGMAGDGTIHDVQPALSGQCRTDVPKDFDEVWYARIEGTRDQSKGVFQTQPDPLHRCRSRLGCLNVMEDADFTHIRHKVAEFYGVSPDEIWTASHGVEGATYLLEQEAAASEGMAV